MLNKVIKIIREDIQATLSRDPAARSAIEVIFCYAGLHAIWAHRLAHFFWKRQMKLTARLISQFNRFMTGIEIHPGAKIGPKFFIDHGMGVVIGETAEVGCNVTLYHGVTLGGVSLEKGKRHPTLEDNVVVGAGAKILGAITIGCGSRIGANAVVVKTVPPESVVIGVPGQVVQRSKPRPEIDLNHNLLPDTIGDSLMAVMARMDAIEQKIKAQSELLKTNGNGHRDCQPETHPHAPNQGFWRGEDFMI